MSKNSDSKLIPSGRFRVTDQTEPRKIVSSPHAHQPGQPNWTKESTPRADKSRPLVTKTPMGNSVTIPGGIDHPPGTIRK